MGDPQTGLFHGNVKSPWLYLLIHIFSILGGLFFISLGVDVFIPADDTLPRGANLSLPQNVATRFSVCQPTRENGGSLRLYAPGNATPYYICWLDSFDGSTPDPKELCSGEVFTVAVRKMNNTNEIVAVTGADGRPVLSVRDRNAAYKKDQRLAGAGLMGIGALFMLYSICALTAARNPERFPRHIRKLFFDDQGNVFSWESKN